MNQAGDAPLAGAHARRWDFLAGLMNELELKTFVEVGCKEGRVSAFILEHVPGSTVLAIDPWVVQEKPAGPKRETYEEWDFAAIERDFWQNIGERKDRCRMLRTTSLAAAEQHSTGLFDMVFIDAQHDYDSVLADIGAWWPLVREGGILAGHDFNHKWTGVERAVADSFDLMQIGLGPDSVWFHMKHSHDRDQGSVRLSPQAA